MGSIYKSRCCRAPLVYKWESDHLLELCSRCRKVLETRGIVIHYNYNEGRRKYTIEEYSRKCSKERD